MQLYALAPMLLLIDVSWKLLFSFDLGLVAVKLHIFLSKICECILAICCAWALRCFLPESMNEPKSVPRVVAIGQRCSVRGIVGVIVSSYSVS